MRGCRLMRWNKMKAMVMIAQCVARIVGWSVKTASGGLCRAIGESNQIRRAVVLGIQGLQREIKIRGSGEGRKKV